MMTIRAMVVWPKKKASKPFSQTVENKTIRRGALNVLLARREADIQTVGRLSTDLVAECVRHEGYC
jgi:hypothetical protein